MRKVINNQPTLGTIDISQIEFDLKSRDDIPQILRGLQHIYLEKEVREKVFQILERGIAPESDEKNGRPGMDLWKILVMGTLRLNLNLDYDRLHELVNNHLTLRQILGHTAHFDMERYNLQTIKDNVKLLTPKVLSDINKIVVEAGHDLIKKKAKTK